MSQHPQLRFAITAALAGLALWGAACAHQAESTNARAGAECPADIDAAVGQPCASEGKGCGADRCGKTAGFCNFIKCEGGQWKRVEVPPAPPTPAPAAETTPCTRDADCGPSRVCAFAISDRCGAKGQCLPRGPLCNRIAVGCACTGATIRIGCDGRPSGYAPEPLAHDGPCASVPPQSTLPTQPWSSHGPALCPASGTPCGKSCCAAGEICCPGGMAGSYYCRRPGLGRDCPALP